MEGTKIETKMIQVECIHSMHDNLLPDKSMLGVSVGWPRDKARYKSQKFQVPCMNYQLNHSYTAETPLYICYVAHSLSAV